MKRKHDWFKCPECGQWCVQECFHWSMCGYFCVCGPCAIGEMQRWPDL